MDILLPSVTLVMAIIAAYAASNTARANAFVNASVLDMLNFWCFPPFPYFDLLPNSFFCFLLLKCVMLFALH